MFLNSLTSDSAVKNCNRLFQMKNEDSEASKIWKVGKELGFMFSDKEDIVLSSLIYLKKRVSDKVRILYQMTKIISMDVRGLGGTSRGSI